MKIAQIAPLIESVPPRFYGGTERVVSYLTEELVRLGHDVTLFASGDSVTSARLVSCATTALRLDPKVRDPIPYYMLMLDRVRECAEDFDVLHFHIDYYHFPLFNPLAERRLTYCAPIKCAISARVLALRAEVQGQRFQQAIGKFGRALFSCHSARRSCARFLEPNFA